MIKKKLKNRIFPSFLVASQAEFSEKLLIIRNKWSHSFIHIDVMDGTLTPQSCWFDHNYVKTALDDIPFEVHLMVNNPRNIIKKWVSVGACRVYIHAEIGKKSLNTIKSLQNMGVQAGIAINPTTSLNMVQLLEMAPDAILLMGVTPGKSGQKLQNKTFSRIQSLRAAYPNIPIIIDGGVTLENADALIESGATALVSASAVFKELRA